MLVERSNTSEKGTARETRPSALSLLPATEQSVLRHNFGLETGRDMKIPEISEALGITPEEVKAAKNRGLQMLKQPYSELLANKR